MPVFGEFCFWKKLLLTVLLAAAGFAQPAHKLEFEVASVKPTAVDRIKLRSGAVRLGSRVYGERAEYTYMTLRQLMADAYQVRSWQVEGPDWLTTERFDVVCKMPAGSRKEDAPLMLQSLLADRFKLAAAPRV